ncbi:MAG TPA: ATP-binding protein [Steroidobacteraceae bacterium]|jgi:signal transduction histidine kinase
MTWPIVTMAVEVEADIVAIRQRARRLAGLLKFDQQDQARIATAVSEISRNAFSYARGGRAEFTLEEHGSPQMLLIRVTDRGRGIADLDAVLEGRYQSQAGMGVGIIGARRLLHHFRITSSAAGTQVELGHRLPASAPRITQESLNAVVQALSRQLDEDPLIALRQQNLELMQTLEEVRRRQEETDRLSNELDDTNRGVVALYAELEERAEQLRRASEIKSRFLSNMSHEFRTPLNSVMALSRLLLDGVDGDLSEEQRKQLGYIRKSAQDLLELVNDLLDLAKVEAGKIEIKPADFTVPELFSSLRGVLKPLSDATEVELIFEITEDLPQLHTDEGKVAQVLRNFIANALKFTERGEVRVSAHHDSRAGSITFMVADTGIGIAPQDLERVFEEFTQVDGGLQRHTKGTGLGLPLSRQLATLLHGEIWVDSELGRGSTFFMTVPLRFEASVSPPTLSPSAALPRSDGSRKRVLLIDDDETFRYVLRQMINDQQRYEIFEAVDGADGLQQVHDTHPDLVVLDLQMPRVDGLEVLRTLQRDPANDALPIIVATSQYLDTGLMAQLPVGMPVLSKQTLSRERVGQMVRDAIGE